MNLSSISLKARKVYGGEMYMSHIMIIVMIKSEKHTLGRKYRLECTKLTRFKKNLQATLACRTSQPVVIYLNCPAATAAC